MPRESEIGRRASEALALPIEIVHARTADMTPSAGEHLILSGKTGQRREDWLRGRTALKGVLRRLGRGDDTAEIAFPNPQLSITHIAGIAAAAGTNAPNSLGIGIDLEERFPRPETARFFLSKNELAWLETAPSADQPRHLRRLWTVKEAVFKADPGNRRTAFTDYRLDSPAVMSGAARATLPEGPCEIVYASFDCAGRAATIAACRAWGNSHA